MTIVTNPEAMNKTFAALFNERNLPGLLSLYEAHAVHRNTVSGAVDVGLSAIESALEKLLALPGKMTSTNNFTLTSDGIALLRADWKIEDDQGLILAQGASAEVARLQPDGRWLSLIDHALGCSAPPALPPPLRQTDGSGGGNAARVVLCTISVISQICAHLARRKLF